MVNDRWDEVSISHHDLFPALSSSSYVSDDKDEGDEEVIARVFDPCDGGGAYDAPVEGSTLVKTSLP